MAAVANNPSFAKKVGVPQPVGKDFNDADKGKFSKGGDTMKKMDPKMMAMMMAKKRGMGAAPAMAPRMAPRMAPGMAGGGMPMKDGKPAFIGDGKGAMKHGGGVKKMANGGSASSRADGVASKGKTKGTFVAMKNGGKAC